MPDRQGGRAQALLPLIGIAFGAELVAGAAVGWVRFLFGPTLRLGHGFPDFLLYYALARLEAARGFAHIYDQSAVLDFERRVTGVALGQPLPLTSPPYVAILVRPLAALDFKTAYVLWALLSAVFLAVAIVALVRASRLRGRSAWAVGLLAAAWAPTLVAGLQAQLAGLVLLGAALAALAWTRGREGRAGFASILTLARPHLVLLLPVLFLVRRSGRAFGALLAGAVVLFAVTLPVTGLRAWSDYVAVLTPGVLRGNQGFANAEQAPFALRGVVEAVAGASVLDVAIPFILLIAVAVIVARTPSRPLLDFALVTVASFDASLHQNLHDLTLLLVGLIPTAGLLLAGELRHRATGWLAIGVCYVCADVGLVNQLLAAAGVQVLLAYLVWERLAPVASPARSDSRQAQPSTG
ncbi:MAG TPA: glycosyltransferase family 87 protein [Candidatus Dormibacteraeota bacterium]